MYLGGQKDNSANIQIYESNTTAAQKWKVTHDEKVILRCPSIWVQEKH